MRASNHCYFHYRAKVMDAKNKGEKCAMLRLIDLAETNTCNVIDCPPGIAKYFSNN